jgi:hypothetical protein
MNIINLTGYEVYVNGNLAYSEKENPEGTRVQNNTGFVYPKYKSHEITGKLLSAYKELKKAQDCQKIYSYGLQEMIFMISHKVRQPIAHILGLLNVLDWELDIPEKLKELMNHIRGSATSLDVFTEELTLLMANLEQKTETNIDNGQGLREFL